jgi:hypothetical protein
MILYDCNLKVSILWVCPDPSHKKSWLRPCQPVLAVVAVWEIDRGVGRRRVGGSLCHLSETTWGGVVWYLEFVIFIYDGFSRIFKSVVYHCVKVEIKGF